jgi:Protein of unknown function (DUF2971)
MKYPEIQSLYKYMSWNEFTIDSIKHGEFWFSSPTKFNDPIDCGISLNTYGNTPLFATILANGLSKIGQATGATIRNPLQKESIAESVQELASVFITNNDALGSELSEAAQDQAAYKSLKEKFASSGILSLSELGDNILMWSHYAQQHKGICIEFERNSSNFLGNQLYTLPVRYSIKAPIINAKSYRHATKDEQNEMELSLVLTKASDWTYEREWRAIKIELADSIQPLDCRIASITLGLRTEEDAKSHVLSLAKTKGFKVNRTILKPNEFGLKIEQIQ